MIDLTTEFGQRAKKHLEEEYFIWFTTIGSDLTSQPRPVWFIWEDNSILNFNQPDAYKATHLKQHHKVALHFNIDAKANEDVIIFFGKAKINPGVQPAHKVYAYFEKYKTGMEELDMTPEAFSKEYSLAMRVKPTKLRDL